MILKSIQKITTTLFFQIGFVFKFKFGNTCVTIKNEIVAFLMCLLAATTKFMKEEGFSQY